MTAKLQMFLISRVVHEKKAYVFILTVFGPCRRSTLGKSGTDLVFLQLCNETSLDGSWKRRLDSSVLKSEQAAAGKVIAREVIKYLQKCSLKK